MLSNLHRPITHFCSVSACPILNRATFYAIRSYLFVQKRNEIYIITSTDAIYLHCNNPIEPAPYRRFTFSYPWNIQDLHSFSVMKVASRFVGQYVHACIIKSQSQSTFFVIWHFFDSPFTIDVLSSSIDFLCLHQSTFCINQYSLFSVAIVTFFNFFQFFILHT